MDYYEIGQRIRKYRKSLGLSQDELAEKVGISVTHMSHIETGNTKLSLPVLAALSEALDVHADDLLFNQVNAGRTAAIDEAVSILNTCNTQQIKVITDIIKTAKTSMDKYL